VVRNNGEGKGSPGEGVLTGRIADAFKNPSQQSS